LSNVSVNELNHCTVDSSLTTSDKTATADLAHLLLRVTQPNPHAKAKEPNAFTPFYLILLINARQMTNKQTA
jgi:hypothetical protein